MTPLRMNLHYRSGSFFSGPTKSLLFSKKKRFYSEEKINYLKKKGRKERVTKETQTFLLNCID